VLEVGNAGCAGTLENREPSLPLALVKVGRVLLALQ